MFPRKQELKQFPSLKACETCSSTLEKPSFAPHMSQQDSQSKEAEEQQQHREASGAEVHQQPASSRPLLTHNMTRPLNHATFSRQLSDALKQHLLHTHVVGTRKDVFLRGASFPAFGYLRAGPPGHSSGEGLLPRDSSPATHVLCYEASKPSPGRDKLCL